MIALSLLMMISASVAGSEHSIHWQAWSQAAFAQARQLNRPMLINVGHEGCIACRWMKNDTFSDPTIIELINANFIAVQVDSEMQPDIGERYSDWAWPATAFNRPDGTQVLAIRGNRKPDEFRVILNKIIKGHQQGTLEPDQLAPYGVPAAPRDTALSAIRQQVRTQLDANFDDKLGGWGESKILEHAEPILHYAVRSHLENDALAHRRFLKTVNGFMHHLDPVWGGVFYESLSNWDDLILEKRLETQAAALQLFATAYKLTGETRFSEAMARIHQYLNNHLRAKKGLFFASQQANLPRLPERMSLTDYYRLDDKARRAIGMPSIDRALYTDLNARIISGLVSAYVSTNNANYLATAIHTADTLMSSRRNKDGSFVQFSADAEFRHKERIHVVQESHLTYLRPHAYLGLAFLDLYQASADDRWLQEAKGIATILTRLQDDKLGGFYATQDPLLPRKPLEDNAVAARFLYLLGTLLKNKEYNVAAERAIRASAASDIVKREGRITGNLALTLELLTAGYVEFSIVGDPRDPSAQALFKSARELYEPRKILHYELAGRYPKRDQPALYICNPQACSVPIYDIARVAVEAKKFNTR